MQIRVLIYATLTLTTYQQIRHLHSIRKFCRNDNAIFRMTFIFVTPSQLSSWQSWVQMSHAKSVGGLCDRGDNE